jgi:hypothetical protein
MKALNHTHKEQSRHDAQVRGGDACVAASRVVGTTTLATLFTAKIKPHCVSGGLPKEGNP